MWPHFAASFVQIAVPVSLLCSQIIMVRSPVCEQEIEISLADNAYKVNSTENCILTYSTIFVYGQYKYHKCYIGFLSTPLTEYYYYYVFILSAISPYTTGLKALLNESDCTGIAPTHK